jgi:phosphatidylglycerophosphate synthase
MFNVKKKYFSKAAENNPTVLLLYYIGWPLVIFFEKIKIHPNFVTLLSLFLTSFSFLYLSHMENLIYFYFVFFFSIILDHVDGPLARKTKKITNKIDHNCDVARIIIMHLGLAIKFDIYLIYFLTTISIFLFLKHEYLINFKKIVKKEKYKKEIKTVLIREKFILIKFIFNIFLLGVILKFFYRFCTTLQQQAVLIFIISPINILYCKIVLSFFIFVCFFSLIKIITKFKTVL